MAPRISVPRASVTGEATLAILNAAVEHARREGCEIVVAVVDASGALSGFLATEGAARISHSVAQAKAYTAATTGMSTLDWKHYTDGIPEHERQIIERHADLIAADGGFPILDGERIVGGVGASGANQEIDAACAQAGLAALAGFERADPA